MKLNKNTNILIVGLGLMGGSYAARLSQKGYVVQAIDVDPDAIAYAQEQALIADGSTELDADRIHQADLLIFGLYPKTMLSWIQSYGHLIQPHTLVTDVSGVKTALVDRVQALLPPGVEYISAHPMAGREYCGVRAASAEIFNEANFIIVPTDKNSPAGIQTCRALAESLDVRSISILSPEEHDDMIAFVSQLTHCLAVALMTCQDKDPEESGLARYTGDSFRELTRIAKINDKMWPELFFMNKEALLRHMDSFENSLNKIRQCIVEEDEETLRKIMQESTRRRTHFDR